MSRAKSILEFLTKENPELQQLEAKSKNNTSGFFYTPKQMVEWKEFSFETLRTIYDGSLMATAEEERSSLPHHPYLSPKTDSTVRCEGATRHILTKWNHSIVQTALDTIEDSFNACQWTPYPGERSATLDDRNPSINDSSSPVPTPSVQSGSTRNTGRPQKRVLPDAGTTLTCRTHGAVCPSSSFERLPKEYKPASKWRSSDVTENEQVIDDNGTLATGASKNNGMMPLRQAYTYCVKRQCRYGCILTTEEAFIFRIKPRSRGNQKTLITNLQIDGLMEYVSIPWEESGRSNMTFNLALWFVHILAGNRHEIAYDYDDLVEEEIVTETCTITPIMPVTPQTEPCRSSSEQRNNATSPTVSRKRRRSFEQDPMCASFAQSLDAFPQSPDQYSQTSEETNENDILETPSQLKPHPLEHFIEEDNLGANNDEGRNLKRRRSGRRLRRD